MSDEERKFFEKYDKKIDKKNEKLINGLSERQAKNNDEIKKAKYKIDYLQDKKKHPAKTTEYIGLILSFLSVIIGALQLIQK